MYLDYFAERFVLDAHVLDWIEQWKAVLSSFLDFLFFFIIL